MFCGRYALSAVCLVVVMVTGAVVGYGSEAGYPVEYTGQNEPDMDEVSDVVKRYGINSDCRRCMLRRDDWRSCWSCFSRPGPVPFYGGFAKRSEPSPDRDASGTIQKRTLDACRCCLRSPSTNWWCCQNCNVITPFYGGYRRKRGYGAGSVQLEPPEADDTCERCCAAGPTYDFYCCAFYCGAERRK